LTELNLVEEPEWVSIILDRRRKWDKVNQQPPSPVPVGVDSASAGEFMSRIKFYIRRTFRVDNMTPTELRRLSQTNQTVGAWVKEFNKRSEEDQAIFEIRRRKLLDDYDLQKETVDSELKRMLKIQPQVKSKIDVVSTDYDPQEAQRLLNGYYAEIKRVYDDSYPSAEKLNFLARRLKKSLEDSEDE
jgi:hypothetical protein